MKSIIALTMLLITGLTFAQMPNDTVLRMPDGKIEIQSSVMATNGCYSAGRAVTGAPSGVSQVKNAILITYPLQHSGAENCTMMMTLVRFKLLVAAPKNAQAIIIYTTDSYRKTISARALALPK